MLKKNHAVMICVLLCVLLFTSTACGPASTPAPSATAAPTQTPQPMITQAPPTQSPPTQTPTAADPELIYKVGDAISLGGYLFSVIGWEEVPPNDFSKPVEGKKIVAVELVIVNNGSAPAIVSTLLLMSLTDEAGQKYEVDVMASSYLKASSLDSELAPGDVIRGKVAFQVPLDVKGLEFVFDDSLFSKEKAFIDLGPAPVAVEPPAELVGKSSEPVHRVGETITLGTVNLTVNSVASIAGNQLSKPDAGNKYLVIDLTIENKGGEAVDLSSVMQTRVKDNQGQQYGVDLMSTLASGGSIPDGPIAPGKKLRGKIGFQVPEKSGDLVFVFDGSFWNTGKVFVHVK